MRIVFAGTPEVAVPSLRALATAHDVVGVVTRVDAPVGRKRVLTASPVAREAAALGLPTHKTSRLDAEATAWVAERTPDLGVIVAYGALVREPLLRTPTLGWINVHFSELPHWRGAAPVQRALMAGEQRLGVSVFRLVPELDAGDLLARDALEVPPGTSAGDALSQLATFSTATLERAITRLANDPLAGDPQVGAPTVAAKLTRADGRLDVSRSASEVLARWAGTTPEPGAFALLDDAPVKLLAVRPLPDHLARAAVNGASAPGTVRLLEGAAVLTVGDGALALDRVQPAGKAAMGADDWLRGRGGEAVLT